MAEKIDMLVDMELYFKDSSGECQYMGTITIECDTRVFYMAGDNGQRVCEYALPPMRLNNGYIEHRVRTRPMRKIDVSE